MINNNTRMLLVEDDTYLGFLLKENYEGKGYLLDWKKDGLEGLEAFNSNKYDICIFDVMLPKMDGFTLARQVKNKDLHMPIIFLTAKNMEEDKMEGFSIGADDYVSKPFSANELLLRVNAILKRTRTNSSAKQEINFQLGKTIFDYTNRVLITGQDVKKLSTKENELLKLFASNLNLLVKRNDIMKEVWGNDDYFTAKSMDVYLSKIRKLLKDEPLVEIQNFHGTGYKMIVRS